MSGLLNKNLLLVTYTVLLGFMFGCQSNVVDSEAAATNASKARNDRSTIEIFSPNVDSITQDFRTFWNYWNSNTNLATDYIALNEKGKKIAHDLFLKTLKTGHYLPVLVKKDSTISYYQLIRTEHVSDHNISSTISYEATRYYKYCKMEGKSMPDFNFKDLAGNIYNNKNMIGKILVLNTWFVKCGACKEEMPDLNRLQKSYQNRNDMVFLGLCLDDADSIHKFLSHIPFTYHIIPDAQKYNQTSLEVDVYPTNIIIDKKGKIVKVMEGNFDALKLKLAKVSSKD